MEETCKFCSPQAKIKFMVLEIVHGKDKSILNNDSSDLIFLQMLENCFHEFLAKLASKMEARVSLNSGLTMSMGAMVLHHPKPLLYLEYPGVIPC